ncbi:MAG TPA: phage capsid protein [Candidatus Limnocylindria bacterium]|nr:phage capsid protein [Candidatus Limnocylindria bacterium]
MPVSLAQAKLNAANDIDYNIIDEFRKSSWLFDNITFDDVVNPAGGGATLTYGYERVVTEGTAAFRAINAEYTPAEATKEQITVDLKPFGGSYQIDRVLGAIARGREIVFQNQQKVKAARAKFNDAILNGDSGSDANSFDGLDPALTGSDTEDTTGRDWQTIDEAGAFEVMDDIDSLLALLDGDASAIIANRKALAKIRSAARRAGYFTRSENSFGSPVELYNGVALIDPGKKPGSSTDVLPVTAGLTDVYAVRLGLDGVHAISLAGQTPVRAWLPDFSTAGAVKTGEVEMVAALALKATRAAAVLRDVQVEAAS